MTKLWLPFSQYLIVSFSQYHILIFSHLHILTFSYFLILPFSHFPFSHFPILRLPHHHETDMWFPDCSFLLHSFHILPFSHSPILPLQCIDPPVVPRLLSAAAPWPIVPERARTECSRAPAIWVFSQAPPIDLHLIFIYNKSLSSLSWPSVIKNLQFECSHW